MTQTEYEKLVEQSQSRDKVVGVPTINGIPVNTSALAIIVLGMIDQYNLMGSGKGSVYDNQYSQGNDCPMPKGCWEEGSYLDGIYQQFSKEYSAGWPAVQPSFKLDMSANAWNGMAEASAYLTNPNYAAAASGYNRNSAVMPAVSAWPAYVSAGRGQTEDQIGYVSGQNVLVAQGAPANTTYTTVETVEEG